MKKRWPLTLGLGRWLSPPVSAVVSAVVIARRYPARSAIWWATPISVYPSVTAPGVVPVAVDPNKSGTWRRDACIDSRGRGWRGIIASVIASVTASVIPIPRLSTSGGKASEEECSS